MILTSAALMLSAAGAWALPKCPSDPNVVWSNCYGTYTDANGNKYVGEFQDGKANGQGTSTFASGAKYVGEVKDNKANGQGTYTYADGGKYVGEVKDDRRYGQGTYTYANGDKYVGEFKDEKRNGQGTYTYANGTVEEGIWENDEFKYANKADPPKASVLQVAFTQLSQSQRKQIQSNLSRLSLYASSVDGVYGKRTAAALTSYNKMYLNDSDLTKAENVGNLIDSVLALEAQKAKPPAVTDAKLQDDEVLEASSGSGFAVSSDGYVITNNHVIEGCQEVAVYEGGRAVPATVVTYDLQNDLALLKGDFTPKTVFALSDDQPELLQDVYVAGYPFGNEISSSIKVTKGIISSLTGIGNNFSNIQIDAALQVGNSGGPILDEMGNVVGVAVSKLDAKYMYDNFGTIPENTNFGIKANVVRNVLDSNGVSSPSPRTDEITKSELGTRITGGTYYVSCMMTLAQIEVLRTKKVMFENLD